MTALVVLGVLAILSIGMAAISAFAIKWAVRSTGPFGESVVQFLLVMMAGMFVGVVVYFVVGGPPGLVEGFWGAALIMSFSVLIVILGLTREVRLRTERLATGPPHPGRAPFLSSVVVLVLLNEVLMGWSFSLLAGTLPVGVGKDVGGTLSILTGAVTSYWFVFPMALEMLATIWFFRRELPPVLSRFLLVQPAIMVCSPPTIAGLPWLLSSIVAGSSLMAAAIAWLLILLFRGTRLAPSVARYLLALFVSFGLMAGGLSVWIEDSNAALFALSLVVQMVIFLWAVTNLGQFGEADGERPDRSMPGPDRLEGVEVEGS